MARCGFLMQEIEAWCKSLANNLALRNPALTQDDLDGAMQCIIVRIIFLRMCEGRGIERHGELTSLLHGPAVWCRLTQLFQKADERYRSMLFHSPQENGQAQLIHGHWAGLAIDDGPLADIIQSLYFPHGPFELSELPPELLGQAYEQCLAKTMGLAADRRAWVEGKPRLKKSRGVYYTPKEIVAYVVEHTVGKLLEGKTPRQAAKLRIVDPACGSGSFLLGAYRHLLDWHRDWYVADGPERHRVVYRAASGWCLTADERQRIIVDNIHGVDIDRQAVEITKLSLLLEMLEGESLQTRERQISRRRERALPDLGHNIQCGNALLGPDFYENQPPGMVGGEKRVKSNAFDWNAAYPAIMKTGGFDAVIGNPPWGQKEIDAGPAIKRYLRERYPSSRGIYDAFRPFVELGIDLLSDGGALGMVLPDIILLKDYAATRQCLLERLTLTRIDWWGMAFARAVIDAATIIGCKGAAPHGHRLQATVRDNDQPIDHEFPQEAFWANPRLVFNLSLTSEKRLRLQRLASCPKLGSYFEVHEGVHSGNIRRDLFVDSPVDETCRELYFGRGEILPYRMEWKGQYIRLAALPETRTRQRYANPGRPQWHEREKVLVRRTGDYVLAAVDGRQRYASNNFFLVFPKQLCSLDLLGLCALLNSAPMTWYFRTVEPRRGRVFAELKIKHLTDFPLPRTILNANGCQALNELGAERTRLAARNAGALCRQANCVDSQIDTLVHEVLGLCEA